MSELKVKTQSLSKRCEICHQIDLFNPQTESCSRCSCISIKSKKQLSNISANHKFYNELKNNVYTSNPISYRQRSELHIGNLSCSVTMLVRVFSLVSGFISGLIGTVYSYNYVHEPLLLLYMCFLLFFLVGGLTGQLISLSICKLNRLSSDWDKLQKEFYEIGFVMIFILVIISLVSLVRG